MFLLDVNVLVALAWDSHVHHVAAITWFRDRRDDGWSTCPLTESGFVRVSSSRHALPRPTSPLAARAVLGALRSRGRHSFRVDDVSETDPDVPALTGHRQVTDAHLLALARRNGLRLTTFDGGLALLGGVDVEHLHAL